MKKMIEQQKLRQEGAVKVLANIAISDLLENFPDMDIKDACKLLIQHFKEVKKEAEYIDETQKKSYDDLWWRI